MVTCIMRVIMDVVHKQVEMEYDLFQLCMLFGMKIILHG
jgi:hypothetical protein